MTPEIANEFIRIASAITDLRATTQVQEIALKAIVIHIAESTNDWREDLLVMREKAEIALKHHELIGDAPASAKADMKSEMKTKLERIFNSVEQAFLNEEEKSHRRTP